MHLQNASPPTLTENQKNAYRHLLYMAMLDIRPMQSTLVGLRYLRPRRWRQLVHEAKTNGALACWLHNLAHFASFDFDHFDEANFWADGGALAR